MLYVILMPVWECSSSLVKTVLKSRNGRHIRIVARTKSGVEDWFRVVGCLV